MAEIRKDSGTTNWALLGFGGTPKLHLLGTGNGGATELKTKLADNDVCFGLLRVQDNADGHPTNKFVLVHVVGASCNGMFKGRVSMQRATIVKMLEPFHVEYSVEGVESVSEPDIQNRVSAASGSLNRIQ